MMFKKTVKMSRTAEEKFVRISLKVHREIIEFTEIEMN